MLLVNKTLKFQMYYMQNATFFAEKMWETFALKIF